MEYDGKPITIKNKPDSKTGKLLYLLLHAFQTSKGEKKIMRQELIETVYRNEELSDVGNNLRVAIHRLKKLLVEAGLPEYNYIQMNSGGYEWVSPMPVWLDTKEFSDKIEKAEKEQVKEKKFILLKEACELYKGEFLPELSGEDWVIISGVNYKKQYAGALQQVLEFLKEKEDYKTMLEMASNACKLYPFEEWQVWKIEALTGLERYKEAMEFYEETTKMLFEELGISPSEEMMEKIHKMSGGLERSWELPEEIKENLQEKEYEQGAFYMNFPSFRDGYRLIRRIVERNGQSVYLMICTLMDASGNPIEKAEKKEVLSQQLHKAIKTSFRRGDVFTKYSPDQFLILLIGTNQENCVKIFKRISDHFSEKHKAWKQNLNYYISSITDITKDGEKLHFNNNSCKWH